MTPGAPRRNRAGEPEPAAAAEERTRPARDHPARDHPAWLVHLSGDVAVSRMADGAGPPPQPVPVSGRQAAIVLAMLAHERREVSREEIAEVLWGDERRSDAWASAVRIVVSKVRAAFTRLGADADAVRSAGGWVSLRPAGGWTTDLELAERVVDAAEQQPDADPDAVLASARAVRARIHAPPLAGAEVPFAARLAERASAVIARAWHLEIRALLRLGDLTAAAAHARDAIDADALDEVAHHLLVEALLAADQPAAAWRAYGRLAEVLHAELGVTPAESTRALLARRRPPGAARPRPPAGRLAFLGREEELAQLDELWEQVVDGQQPGLAVIEGVTGIGKTRLVREVSESLRSRGAQVLWGAAHQGSERPYEPFADALRRRLAAPGHPDAGPTPGPVLAALLGLPSAARERPVAAPSSVRAELFYELGSLVEELVAGPTVWVVDDAQWASEDSLALVDLLLESPAPLLMVVIVRNEPARVSRAVSRWLHAVPSTAIELGPLTTADLGPIASEIAELVPEPGGGSIAEWLHARTGGHPFFVAELAGRARRSGVLEPDGAPAGVRAWVRHRVAAFPREEGGVLAAAAVIGERVDVELLAETVDGTRESVATAIDVLTDEGFLAESDTADSVTFAHQITHDAVLSLIRPVRLAALHLRVAEALQARAAVDPGEVAAHLLRAGGEHAGRAVGFALLAARRSLAVGAWASARAQLAEVDGLAADPPTLAGVAVARGIACHQLNDVEGAVAALNEAAEIARRHRCAPELAAAVLRMVGRAGRGAAVGLTDGERVAMLQEVLEALRDWPLREDEEDNAEVRELLAVRAEGELSWAALFLATYEERRSVALGGIARIAGRADVPPELYTQAVLNARSVQLGGAALAERLAASERTLALPEDQISPDAMLSTLLHRQEDLIIRGDLPGARAALDGAAQVAHRWAIPHGRWAVGTWSALQTAIVGDLEVAEARLEAVTAQAQGLGPEVAACRLVQLTCLRLLGGRPQEVLAPIVAAADASPHIPCYRAVEALVAVEAGDASSASRALERCAVDSFSVIPHDSNRFLALAVLGDVVAELGRTDLAPVLLGQLEQWSGQQVLLNCYAGGGAFWGPVDRVLGRLASLLGDERAPGWFLAAGEQAAAMQSPWAIARVRADRGEP